jgi:hypothetical protein
VSAKWSSYSDKFIRENYFFITEDIWTRYKKRKLGIYHRDLELKEIRDRLEAMRRQTLPPPVPETETKVDKGELHGLYVETAEAIEIPLEASAYARKRKRRKG